MNARLKDSVGWDGVACTATSDRTWTAAVPGASWAERRHPGQPDREGATCTGRRRLRHGQKGQGAQARGSSKAETADHITTDPDRHLAEQTWTVNAGTAIDDVNWRHAVMRLHSPQAAYCGAEGRWAQWMGILSYGVTTPRR